MRLVPALASAALALSVATASFAQDAPKPAPAQARKAKKDDKPAGPVASFLGFESIAGGGSRIYVELSGQVNVTQHDAQGQIVYVLEGVQIKTSNTENALELYYHNTPVLRAKLHRSKKDKTKKDKPLDAELWIQLKADAKPTQKMVEGRKGTYLLQIDFPAGNFAPGEGAPPPPPPAPPKKEDPKAKPKAPAAPAPKAGPATP